MALTSPGRELGTIPMAGLASWSLGRSEPPAPASLALPARMDALTQLLALCYRELQPGMKTRAGAALMETRGILGRVFHAGPE